VPFHESQECGGIDPALVQDFERALGARSTGDLSDVMRPTEVFQQPHFAFRTVICPGELDGTFGNRF